MVSTPFPSFYSRSSSVSGTVSKRFSKVTPKTDGIRTPSWELTAGRARLAELQDALFRLAEGILHSPATGGGGLVSPRHALECPVLVSGQQGAVRGDTDRVPAAHTA